MSPDALHQAPFLFLLKYPRRHCITINLLPPSQKYNQHFNGAFLCFVLLGRINGGQAFRCCDVSQLIIIITYPLFRLLFIEINRHRPTGISTALSAQLGVNKLSERIITKRTSAPDSPLLFFFLIFNKFKGLDSSQNVIQFDEILTLQNSCCIQKWNRKEKAAGAITRFQLTRSLDLGY